MSIILGLLIGIAIGIATVAITVFLTIKKMLEIASRNQREEVETYDEKTN